MRVLILISLAACSPYSPDLTMTPFFCGSSAPQCPDGYACSGADGSGRMLCMKSSGGPDANDLMKMCADDSSVETPTRNDTVATAFPLPSPLPQNPFLLSGLAICPMGDKDNYSLVTTASMSEIKVDMTYDSWGSPLQGELLNSGGTPIKTMTPVSGMSMVMEADVAGLPPDKYFIQVFGPSAAPGINNYKLSISVM
jgi:hypothetical protein